VPRGRIHPPNAGDETVPSAVFAACLAALALALAFRLAAPTCGPCIMTRPTRRQVRRTARDRDYRYDRTITRPDALLPDAARRLAARSATLASLDERTLRAVPAAFGAACCSFSCRSRAVSAGRVAAAALLAAVSPF